MTDQANTGAKVTVPKTFRSGPSDPIAFADGVGTFVEVNISAPTAEIWPIVTDIEMPAQFSEEMQGARWVSDDITLGAEFIGTSENATMGRWDLSCFISRFELGEMFGWATGDAETRGAEWWFTLTPTPTGTNLRFDVSIGPGPSGLSMVLESMPDKEPRILSGRLRQMHTSMTKTVNGVRDFAEGRSQS